MGTDASRLDRLELGCNCLGAKGNERFGEGVLMRKKKKARVFNLSMGRQQSLPWLSQYLRNKCLGGGLLFFCTDGEDNWRDAWSWGEGWGVLWESPRV